MISRHRSIVAYAITVVAAFELASPLREAIGAVPRYLGCLGILIGEMRECGVAKHLAHHTALLLALALLSVPAFLLLRRWQRAAADSARPDAITAVCVTLGVLAAAHPLTLLSHWKLFMEHGIGDSAWPFVTGLLMALSRAVAAWLMWHMRSSGRILALATLSVSLIQFLMTLKGLISSDLAVMLSDPELRFFLEGLIVVLVAQVAMLICLLVVPVAQAAPRSWPDTLPR